MKSMVETIKTPQHFLKGVSKIVEDSSKYAIQYLQSSRCGSLPFHNVQHTLDVFLNVTLIGYYLEISSKELEIVQLAALFHDLGNAHCFDGHEKVSVQIAERHLHANGFKKVAIEEVVQCITATQIPQAPKNNLGSILCDADLFHLGTHEFLSLNPLLRKEWATCKGQLFNEGDWLKLNIEFLEGHSYFTEYGKQVLEDGKRNNIQWLKEKQK